MSDISKRIHSIDPVEDKPPLKMKPVVQTGGDDIPEFVRRNTPTSEPIIPLLQSENRSGAWLLWTGGLLAILWMISAGAYFYFQPLGALDNLSAETVFFLTAAVLFPALLILLFFIAARKLSNVTAQAEHLTTISQSLLRADETSAAQATNLAGAIREEMNRLNEDLANLTDRLRFLQDSASDHAENLQTSSSSFLTTSDVIGQNLKIQRQSLESMAQTTEAKLDSLSALVSSHEKALKDTTESASQKLITSGDLLEERLGKYKMFVAEAEAQLLNTAETLENTKTQTSGLLENLDSQSVVISEKMSALNAQSEKLQTLMAEKLEALEAFNEANIEANSALSETIQHSITATDKLREETGQTEARIAQKREELAQSIEAADAKIKQTIDAQNALLLSKLDETETILSKLDGRIARLKHNTEMIEGAQLSKAETRDLSLDIPDPRPRPSTPPSPLGKRLSLKPLDVEPDNFGTEPLPKAAGDYDLSVEQPLDLDLNMRVGTGSSTTQADSSQRGALSDEVVKPLTRSEPIFGGQKKTEKSPWRWKDMMGGFDNDSAPAPETRDLSEDAPVPLASPPLDDVQKVQSFEAWLSDFDLNPDDIVSDGTILDFANTMIQAPAETETILTQRMPDMSEHLRALSANNPGLNAAAHVTAERFGDTINAEIMNRDAIRNRLSTRDGRAYLLALLCR